jgi:hypothetical protein
MTLRAIRLLLDLEREFPAGFGFREHGGLSLITMTPWTTPAELALNLAVVGALGLEDLVGKLFTGRLRLFSGLPLVEAARRDGLLVRRYADPLLDTARRNLYAPEIPWRFARPEMENLSRVLVRLDRDAGAASDPLSRRVSAMGEALGCGVTARSVAAALTMVDAAMLASSTGRTLTPAALLQVAAGAAPGNAAPGNGVACRWTSSWPTSPRSRWNRCRRPRAGVSSEIPTCRMSRPACAVVATGGRRGRSFSGGTRERSPRPSG